MDLYDQAQARESLDRDIALAQRKPVAPEVTGRCLNCGTYLRPRKTGLSRRWCDAECRDDWVRAQRGGPAHG